MDWIRCYLIVFHTVWSRSCCRRIPGWIDFRWEDVSTQYITAAGHVQRKWFAKIWLRFFISSKMTQSHTDTLHRKCTFVYVFVFAVRHSPWRGSGSWTARRRSPPYWPRAGRRRSSCPCSRTASACSCAWWPASRTAPAHAWRSREQRSGVKVETKWVYKMQFLTLIAWFCKMGILLQREKK